MKQKTFPLSKWHNARGLIIILALALIPVNIFYYSVFIYRKMVMKVAWIEPGYQFHHFQKFIQGEKTIGYITDKTLSREKNDGAYLQAQYYLAPVVVDSSSFDYRYNIVDSENIPFLVRTFKNLNSKRIANNKYGQALIKRTP